MFTKNFNNRLIRSLMYMPQVVNDLSYVNLSGTVYAQQEASSAASQIATLGTWANNNYNNSSAYHANYLWIGSGDTPEDYEDYSLTAFTTSQMTPYNHTIGTYTHDSENHKFYQEISRSFQNSSGQTLVVREFGVCKSRSSSIFQDELLLYRKVLETPITVEANEFVTVTFRYEVPENFLGNN